MALDNNDILRRFRYALNLNDATVLQAFALGGQSLERDELAPLLAREGADNFRPLDNTLLRAFLDGYIALRRGPRPASAPAPAAVRLDNNEILKKMRVALQLREEDLVAIMARGANPVGASEINALFRQRGHPKFKPCGDQFLRNFLTGLETWRPD